MNFLTYKDAKLFNISRHVAKCCTLLLIATQASATGIPVIDATNLQQTILTATESVAQTLKQIEQHKTQLQQYENMLQNTAAPAAYIWDQATVTINKLRREIDTLEYYKSSLGNIDNYLNKFKDVSTYRSSPCFSKASAIACTTAEWEKIKSSAALGSEAQKKSIDAVLKGIDQQQDSIESDARQLEKLQAAAKTAEGQMAAIGFANQLASHQANQLLQIRGLLIAQQNMMATRNQVLADKEARTQAANLKFYDASGYEPYDPKKNKGF